MNFDVGSVQDGAFGAFIVIIPIHYNGGVSLFGF
jgi:hypothetical protein